MEKGNSLPVSVSQELVKIEELIALSDKLSIEYRKEELRKICLANSDFFVSIVSRFFDFDVKIKSHINLIRKYKNVLNWSQIDRNSSFKYSSSFILEFKDLLLWNKKSPFYKQSIIWNEKTIIRCIDKIHFGYTYNLEYSERLFDIIYKEIGGDFLSRTPSLPWSIDFINRHYEKWNWHGLSDNSGIPWSIKLIDTFKEKWNWAYLSNNDNIPWSVDLIKKFRKELNWKAIIANDKTIFFDEDFIQEFAIEIFDIDNIDKKFEPNLGYGKSIADRKDITWTIDLIRKYRNSWNWKDLSGGSKLPWSIELIEEFKDDWVWWKLSRNSNITWSKELVQKYEDYWDWEELSANNKIKFDIDFLSKYKEKLNWERLSQNDGLFANVEIIESFKNDFIWQYLAHNKSIQWDEDLIIHFKENIDESLWRFLVGNNNLKWTDNLLKSYLSNVYDYRHDYEAAYYSIPLTEEFFFDYSGDLHWSWEDFSRSSFINWDLKLIKKYSDKLKWEALSENENFYKKVFLEILDIKFIGAILAKIASEKK